MSTSCHPKCIAGILLRVSLGLSLMFIGVNYYAHVQVLAVTMRTGFGYFTGVADSWAYVMPGLLVIGGVLLLIGQHLDVAAWAAGIALASIPAGLLAKATLGVAPLSAVMPQATQSLLWLIVFYLACSSCCCEAPKGKSKWW